MKTVTIARRVHPGRLHEALTAAGFSVLTVRAIGDRAEVVLDGDPTDAAVRAAAQGHDADADPQRDQLAGLLATLEDQGATDRERLAAACSVLARLVRRELAQRNPG